MEPGSNKSDRRRWAWPRFSLKELLVLVALLAALWGFLAAREETDELIASIVGSGVAVWGLLCWKAVRANR